MLVLMLPRLGSSKLVSTWIWVTVLASLVAAVDGGLVARWAALAPSRILHGEVWRLATWVLVEQSPFGLILTCLSVYRFGGDLIPRWGERRLLRFMVEVVGGAGVVTVLFALISDDAWRMYHLGGWAVGDALVIAWARQYPDRVLVIYGLARLHGRDLITVVIAMTSVYAIYVGPFAMAPELLACAAALWYPSARLMGRT
jgi:hypothetical protein